MPAFGWTGDDLKRLHAGEAYDPAPHAFKERQTMTLRQSLGNVRELMEAAVTHYERTAPPVAAYVDDLYVRLNEKPDGVALSELLAVEALRVEGHWEQPNYAANRFYKLASRLGRDTTGLAGF